MENKSQETPATGLPRTGNIPAGEPITASPQEDSPQTNHHYNQPASSTRELEKKINFWKKLSIIAGILSFAGYFITLIVTNLSAHKSEASLLIFWMVGLLFQKIIFILCALSIIAIIRVIVLSNQRKKHAFKDYAITIIGFALTLSPYAASSMLSLFRITWNDDNSISVTMKSDDPYYITGSSSSWPACKKQRKTSNELKNVNINEYYHYIDEARRRQEFATEYYMESIAEEIMCQVGEFYKNNKRYPSENEIEKLSLNASNDEVRSGVYHIKPEIGAKPNKTDFTVLFGKSCNNKDIEEGNVVVLSPQYNGKGRYCVYDRIDDILEGLEKAEEY